MDLLAFIEGYLSDSENGMKTLITWLLNQVMLQEALQQAGATQYERTDARKAHLNGYKDRSLKTRSSGNSRSRCRSSGAMPGWRRLK
jgi:transposase-like protein